MKKKQLAERVKKLHVERAILERRCENYEKQIRAVKAALGVRDSSFSTSPLWFGQSLAMDQTTGTAAGTIHAVEDAG